MQLLLVSRRIIYYAAIHFHPRVGEEGRGPVANYQTGIDAGVSQQPRRRHGALQTPHRLVIKAGCQANRLANQRLRFRMECACGHLVPCALLVNALKPPREIHHIVASYFPEGSEDQQCVCCSSQKSALYSAGHKPTAFQLGKKRGCVLLHHGARHAKLAADFLGYGLRA